MYTQPFWIPKPTVGRLAIMPRPRGGDWLYDEIAALRQAGVDTLVSLLTPSEERELDLCDEADACAAQALEFIAFPVVDRGVPTDRRAFNELAQRLTTALRDDRSIVIHCRQGVGRSSLLAAHTLVILGTAPDAAFDAIAVARGCTVPDTAEQRAWLVASFLFED